MEVDYKKMTTELLSSMLCYDVILSEGDSVNWEVAYASIKKKSMTSLVGEDGVKLLCIAIENNIVSAAAALLRDHRIDPNVERTRPDSPAVMYSTIHGVKKNNDTSILKLILADGRVIPQPYYLMEVAQYNIEAMRLLLKDGRVDPNSISLDGLAARSRKCELAMAELLADKRYKDVKTQGEKLLVKLVPHSPSMELVSLLLSDQRIDPSAHDNLLLKTLLADNMRSCDMLLAVLRDKRIDIEKLDSEYPLIVALMRAEEHSLSPLFSTTIIVDGTEYKYTEQGCVTALRILLRGSRVNSAKSTTYAWRRSTNGNEALKIARQLSIEGCVKLLELCNNSVDFDPMTVVV